MFFREGEKLKCLKYTTIYFKSHIQEFFPATSSSKETEEELPPVFGQSKELTKELRPIPTVLQRIKIVMMVPPNPPKTITNKNSLEEGCEINMPVLATSTAVVDVNESKVEDVQYEARTPRRFPVHDDKTIPFPTILLKSNSDLGFKLSGDILVAFGVTFAVSPFLSVIDKAIVQKAAGTHSIFQSSLETAVGIARDPVKFFKSPAFLAMWSVYALTYSTGESEHALD